MAKKKVITGILGDIEWSSEEGKKELYEFARDNDLKVTSRSPKAAIVKLLDRASKREGKATPPVGAVAAKAPRSAAPTPRRAPSPPARTAPPRPLPAPAPAAAPESRRRPDPARLFREKKAARKEKRRQGGRHRG